MNKSRVLIKNTVYMTLGAMILRGCGIAYSAYLNRTLGGAGMGFAGLVMTVFSLALTFSAAGISLSVTRLVSEKKYPLRSVIRSGCMYGLAVSLPLSFLLFSFAPVIASAWLGEGAATASLRILAPLLPIISLSSVFRGYFLAVGGILRHTGILLAEMGIRVSVTVSCLTLIPQNSPKESCICLVFGTVAGELAAFFLSFFLYLPEKRRKEKGNQSGVFPSLARIALPDAAGASFRAALSATEHLLIPIGLEKYGLSHTAALAFYGLVHSMALPVVLFPSALLRSISSLMVPELASKTGEEQAHSVTSVLRVCTLYSVFCSGALYLFATPLSVVLYGSDSAAALIKAFALLVPVMFADTAVDGMLKGLDAQFYVMKVNILDSLLSVFAVWLFLPVGGSAAYVAIIIACEIVNFIFSVVKLRKLCNFRFFHLTTLVYPFAFTLLSAGAGKGICRLFNGGGGIALGLLISIVFYLLFLSLAGILPLPKAGKGKVYSVGKRVRLLNRKQ